MPALAVLGLAGGSASAQGVLANSAGVCETATNWSRVVKLPGFDPGLRTLPAVNLIYTLDLWQSVGLENLGSSPASYAASITATLNPGGPGAAAFPAFHPIVLGHSGTLGAFDGSLDDAGSSGVSFDRHYVHMPNTVSVPAADFGDFEVRGDPGYPATVTASSALLADANIDSRTMSSPALTLDVTCVFAPIPEPGPFALLAGAAALASAVARGHSRRRRAA